MVSPAPAVELSDAPSDAEEEEDRFRIWLRAGVVISDPETEPGLIAQVPVDAKIVGGIGYNTKHTLGRKIPCRACPQRQPHYRGFLVELEDGSRGIVGIDCGERYFFEGGQWERMVAAHERRKEMVLYQERSAGTVEKLDAIIPLIRRWAEDAAEFDGLIHQLDEHFPDVVEQLAAVARQGGVLSRPVQVETPYRDRKGNEAIRKSWVQQNIAALPARWLFAGPSLSGELGRVHIALTDAAEKLRHGEQTLAVRAGAFADIRKANVRLRELHEAHAEALRFFEPKFVDVVAKWARSNRVGEGNLRFKRGRLQASDEDYLYGAVSIPERSALPISPWPSVAPGWPRL